MRRRPMERGQAAIEFALTSLLFFPLVLFIMDGGIIFWNYLTVSEAAREGARYAIVRGAEAEKAGAESVGPDGYAALEEEVRRWAIGLDPTHLTVNASWENNSNQRDSIVTVTVSYEVSPITGLFWSGLTFNLSDSSSMAVQY